MKYLLDQGLSRSTVEYLREMGIEAEHVGNLGMAAAIDAEILEEGRSGNSNRTTHRPSSTSLKCKIGRTAPN